MVTNPSVLSGRRIRLVPMRADHHDDLCKAGLDPTLWERTTIRVSTPQEMRAYMDTALRWQEEGHCLPFVIEELSTGDVVGSTRFHHIVPQHRRTEIGFTWISPAWQGKGLNLEAKYLMLAHAFEEWRCVRVELRADSENHPSRRAIERLGATEELTLRQFVVSPHRGPRDLVVYSVIDTEWDEIKDRLRRAIARL